jgi:biopolymer transport protein TolR
MGMGTSSGRGRRGLVSEINVTPLVDVMLVLLIVFMVAAPMMTQGVEIKLPTTTDKPLRQQEDPIVVSINKEGEIFLGKVKMDSSMLQEQLTQASGERKDETVYLRADEEVPYGLVASTMSTIKSTGFEKLGMVTMPPEK